MAAPEHVPTSRLWFASGFPNTADPTELLRRAGRGDETAFAEFYDATSHRLFGLVLRVVRDIALAQEVTQEVYLHAWRHSARFDPDHGSALVWIIMIARRAAVMR
ncbi:MAG: polymerase, sigma subunit, family, partial [Humibacillus sp.]|nr:polymerase, sigma subunit, family [Humibacillus sp.]